MRTVTVAVIGAGRIGAYHAETLAGRLPGVRLQAVADPNEEAARRLLARLDREDVRYVRDYQELLTDPDLEAVVVATPGPTHPEVIIAAAEAGKHVFCEKPLAYTLEEADRALAAVARAGVLLQIGFQRRFDAGFQRARALVAEGALGTVYLVRSLTRDPALTAPASIPPGAIFRETLIHDFDVLRWLAGSEVVEVYALADALIAPEYRARGLWDTAVVSLRFASGAFGQADASFQAVYGYDVRAEVFGSRGMVTVEPGEAEPARHYTPQGVVQRRVHWYLEMFGPAYAAELAHFVACVRHRQPPAVTGQDGRASLAIALAAMESAQTGQPVRLSE